MYESQVTIYLKKHYVFEFHKERKYNYENMGHYSYYGHEGKSTVMSNKCIGTVTYIPQLVEIVEISFSLWHDTLLSGLGRVATL